MLYGKEGEADIIRVIEVLILIFLENALRPNVTGYKKDPDDDVLILIFLENALRHPDNTINIKPIKES